MKDFYSKRDIVFYLSEIEKWQNNIFEDRVNEEISFLCDVLDFLNYFYYVGTQPLVGDDIYDKLFDRLEKIDKEGIGDVPGDAPIFRIGNSITGDRESFQHEIPMISLENSKELQGFDKFLERVGKTISNSFSLAGELKLDGVGFSLEYQNGLLKRALSRGDGSFGEDITLNIKTIKNIPLRINTKGKVLVRGEIVIKNSAFTKMNEKRVKLGEKPRSNPRNTVAGALRTKDPLETAKIPLFAFFYDMPICDEFILENHEECINVLDRLGFYTGGNRVFGFKKDIENYFKKISDSRDSIDVDCDGVVVKINEKELRDILGSTSHHPRWALALKFPANKSLTQILNIEWQLGRTGILTPVAKLKPVNLGGVQISNASLHNYSLFNSLNLAPGDTVEIQRAGDVIPQVTGKVSGSGKAKFKYPKIWNGSFTRIDDNGVFLHCEDPNSDLINFERFKYFVGKSGLDIEGVSEKTIKLLINKGWVKSFSDFFCLEKYEKEWKSLENWGDLSVDNILKGVIDAKNTGCTKLLAALGIPLVGSEVSKLVLSNFSNSIENLFNVKSSQLEKIKGIGIQTANNIEKYFSDELFLAELLKMKNMGIKLSESKVSGKLSGLNVVVTGKLSKSRNEIKKFIESEGGNLSPNITKKTDYLIMGLKPGGKASKALKLGVKTISEEDFYILFDIRS
ncbi:hypothetical protein CL659_04240 [bacterium]|nr:hypothetical protein [bacterium]|tara:strand:- start:16325 stop:18370 length:2046 start_codon:yes stop_codon:yes gene_type:complete